MSSTIFYQGWINPDQKLPAEIPFKITFSAGFIPSVGIDLERLRKDLQIFWEKLKGSKFDATKILTVQECVESISSGKLKEDDEVAIAAFVPDIAPKKITEFPGFSSRGSNFLVSLDRTAGAYCPEIGREFFNGLASNFLYLVDASDVKAFFIRAYFPAAEVPIEYLRMLNNRGVLIYGHLKSTALPYPSIRTKQESENITIERLSEKIGLGIMVRIMYYSKPLDTSRLLKEHHVEEDIEKFNAWADEKYQVFWLYQRI